MLLAFVGGYFLGQFRTGRGGDVAHEEATAAKRVSVPVALSPSLGPADALVTVVEFADFQCGYCSRSVPLQKRLLAEFPQSVRWVFKHFPLDSHPRARDAAKASLAAYGQGKFWEYHDHLFGNPARMGSGDLDALARQLNLDMLRFRTATTGTALDRLIRDDLELGRVAGVQGTPSFFVNGRKFEGSMPYADLERVVRQEMAFAGRLLRRGVAREKLYEELTTKAGGAGGGAPASQPATGAVKGAARGAPRA